MQCLLFLLLPSGDGVIWCLLSVNRRSSNETTKNTEKIPSFFVATWNTEILDRSRLCCSSRHRNSNFPPNLASRCYTVRDSSLTHTTTANDIWPRWQWLDDDDVATYRPNAVLTKGVFSSARPELVLHAPTFNQFINKKLSCRRETARGFVSLNILLSHSWSHEVIRNDTVE